MDILWAQLPRPLSRNGLSFPDVSKSMALRPPVDQLLWSPHQRQSLRGKVGDCVVFGSINRPVAHISQCTSSISHNAPFCSRKPSHESMLTQTCVAMWRRQADFSLVRFCGIHLRAISQRLSKIIFCMISLKIILSNLQPYPPGTNDFKTSEFCKRIWHARDVLLQSHDGIIKWKHFPRYWSFVGGIHWSLVVSPHKGHWGETIETLVIWEPSRS